MKIINKDLHHQQIKIIPETLDDIWHLYNIIQPGDLVRARSYRTDEQSDDKIRSKKSTKKKMLLGIRVEQVKFHEFSDRLRIHGTIEEGPQDLGSYHTLNITVENREHITIVKTEWKSFELKRLDEAVKQSIQSLVTFISLDDEQATIAVLHHSGIQWITDIDSHKSGKQYASEYSEKEYFGEIISFVRHKKGPTTTLVIVGPGFTKDHFITYGKTQEPELFTHCLAHGTGHNGMNGINEAIKSGVIEHVAKENRVLYETALVDQLFQEIRKNGRATYGFQQVEHALQSGAIEHLLIIDALVRSEKGDKLLSQVTEYQTEFTIINSMHDAGKKLEGIGGVGALLRYTLKEP